jgi:hypothetical protein
MQSIRLQMSLWLACLASFNACSRGASKPAQAPAAGEQTAAAPSAARPSEGPVQPAVAPPSSTAATTPPAGPFATEKHRLRITDYAKTPIAVTLNGEWVGQWDDNISVPIDHVLQGKNALTVEVTGEPTNDLKLEIQAERSGDWVSLLDLNFKGKTGTQNIAFSAR